MRTLRFAHPTERIRVGFRKAILIYLMRTLCFAHPTERNDDGIIRNTTLRRMCKAIACASMPTPLSL